jgi:hypothetical protein
VVCRYVIPVSGLIGFLLLGIDQIAIHLEEPFGILPLEAICDTITRNLEVRSPEPQSCLWMDDCLACWLVKPVVCKSAVCFTASCGLLSLIQAAPQPSVLRIITLNSQTVRHTQLVMQLALLTKLGSNLPLFTGCCVVCRSCATASSGCRSP